MRAIRPDLEIRPLRGNVDTRLGKVADGSLDAVVVAAAGLARLGRLDAATELISPEVMVPAPGQGALAVECRAADADRGGWLHDLLASIDDASTRAAVAAERSRARRARGRLHRAGRARTRRSISLRFASGRFGRQR